MPLLYFVTPSLPASCFATTHACYLTDFQNISQLQFHIFSWVITLPCCHSNASASLLLWLFSPFFHILLILITLSRALLENVIFTASSFFYDSVAAIQQQCDGSCALNAVNVATAGWRHSHTAVTVIANVTVNLTGWLTFLCFRFYCYCRFLILWCDSMCFLWDF